jgi:CRP-like cAMP-binding protein
VRFHAISDVTLAVLGADLLRACAESTELLATLEQRASLVHHRDTVLGAICQIPRVQLRLLATLWLISDVVGTACSPGMVIELPLTHEQLGRFVGARRPTVSLAISELGELGLLARRPDGTWLLAPTSREYLVDQFLERDGTAPLTWARRQRGDR